MATVTKAVIAAGGFGTRFLPQTKAIPKEMLPLVDKPIIQYIVEELVAAGITDIIIQTRSSKQAIENHFSKPKQELIDNLKMGGAKKSPQIKEVNALAQMANFSFVHIKTQYGSGAPILDAAELLGSEPFIYTFADDFFVAGPVSRFRQMIELHEARGGSIVSCTQAMQDDHYDRYGFISGEQVSDGVYKMNTIVEKPGKAAAPSNLASVSSYLLEPDIITYLRESQKSLRPNMEFYIQPAMQAMMDQGYDFWGLDIRDGKYYDTGDKLEYLKTVVDFALQRSDIGPALREYIQVKLKN